LKILPCLGKANISKQPKFQFFMNVFNHITTKKTPKINSPNLILSNVNYILEIINKIRFITMYNV